MKVCRGVTSSEKAQVVCAYKTAWRLLKKLKIDLPWDQHLKLLRIYMKDWDKCLYSVNYISDKRWLARSQAGSVG